MTSEKYDRQNSVTARTPNLSLETDQRLFGKSIQQIRIDSNRETDRVAEFAVATVNRFALPSKVETLLADTAIQFGLFSILGDLLTANLIVFKLMAAIVISAVIAMMLTALWYQPRLMPMILYRIVVICIAVATAMAGNIYFNLG